MADPLADSFLALWRTTARVNTEAFRHVFHPVPDDSVLNWRAYDKFYASHFAPAGMVSENREGGAAKPATWRVGHVVPGKFKGDDGRRDLKEWLSRIKGTLVEVSRGCNPVRGPGCDTDDARFLLASRCRCCS